MSSTLSARPGPRARPRRPWPPKPPTGRPPWGTAPLDAALPCSGRRRRTCKRHTSRHGRLPPLQCMEPARQCRQRRIGDRTPHPACSPSTSGGSRPPISSEPPHLAPADRGSPPVRKAPGSRELGNGEHRHLLLLCTAKPFALSSPDSRSGRSRGRCRANRRPGQSTWGTLVLRALAGHLAPLGRRPTSEARRPSRRAFPGGPRGPAAGTAPAKWRSMRTAQVRLLAVRTSNGRRPRAPPRHRSPNGPLRK
mmetsp:Transcript_33214/g.96858  ORF Transcript_33214/g.96858 Transcript_33214/m.96858 type:complete len:251 (+) Transcript_33214:714-1466(+)